jgi:hypothetical protein
VGKELMPLAAVFSTMRLLASMFVLMVVCAILVKRWLSSSGRSAQVQTVYM